MNGNLITRPTYSEGQILSASSLDLGVSYARGSLERHSSKAHTAGVVQGMTITFKPQAPPGTTNDAYVSVGMAVDANGNQINLLSDALLTATALGSQPAGWYTAYVWVSDEQGPVPLAADPCASSVGDTIIEQPNAAFILDTSTTSDAYVCVGQAYWDPVKKGFSDGGTPAAVATGRQLAGVRVGVIIATEGAITVEADGTDPTKLPPVEITVLGDLRTRPQGASGGVIGSDGGSLQLRDAAGKNAVSASYASTSTGGNEFLIGLGNSSTTKNAFVVASDASGTIAASIDAAGNIHATAAISADQSVTAGPSGSGVTIGPTSIAGNPIGISSTGSLLLQFGKNSNAAVYDNAGSEVAEFDQALLKIISPAGEARLGLLASGNQGVETSAGSLDLHAGGGDINLATTGNVTINGNPLWQTIGGAQVLRLGPLAACFGRVSWNGAVNSSGPQLTINFPLAFTAPPQVFLAPVVAGLKVFAVVESVTNVQASITVCHLTPDAPASLNNVKWQNNSLAVDVAWLALGTM
jgi:hypothetical protein